MSSPITLQGKHVVLKPLHLQYLDGLLEAAQENPGIYKYTHVPQNKQAMRDYINKALEDQDKGTAQPWVIKGVDGQVKGSTRCWNIEHWNWPSSHLLYKYSAIDVCEIGHTWLRQSACGTAVNTETKLLLLDYLFEECKTLRVSFRTDVRNQTSKAALERIGAKTEGIIRADRIGQDQTIRDSYRFSIVSQEWPDLREQLIDKLSRY